MKLYLRISQDADMDLTVSVHRTVDAAIERGNLVAGNGNLVLDEDDTLVFVPVTDAANATICCGMWNGSVTKQTYMWVEPTELA